MLRRIALLSFLSLAAADTCLSEGELAGLIFGSIFGTLLICTSIGLILYFFLRRSPRGQKVVQAKGVGGDDVRTTDAGCDPEKAEKNDKFTLIDSYKLKRKMDFSQQKSFSSEHLDKVEAVAAVALQSSSVAGLGFSLRGSMGEGVFVREVIKGGPAEQSQNVFAGDRIRALWISFDDMVFEDAVTILSYASPYKVKLELERKVCEQLGDSATISPKSPRIHPLFRSNSLRHRVEFNPTCVSPVRVESESTTQKFALPKTPEKPEPILKKAERIYESVDHLDREPSIKNSSPEPTSETLKIVEIDETTQKHSKMSSSDYSSNSDVSSLPAEAQAEDHKEDRHSLGESVASSATEEEKAQISDRIETVKSPVPSLPLRSPTPPKPQAASPLPSKQPKRLCEKPPSPRLMSARSHSSPPTARKSAIPTKKPSPPSVPQTTPTKSRIPPPQARAPGFTEVRVSRIPRRDSEKTPVIERKLPRVPSAALNRSNTEDDSTIWSRLYQEKRGQLRKTRDTRAKSEDHIYGTLRREHKKRLTQNDEIIEKQLDELRQLGVL